MAEIKTAEIRPFCLKRYMALFGMRFAGGLFCGALVGALLFLLLDLSRMQIFHGEDIYRSETMYSIDFESASADTVHYYNDYTWNDVMDSDVIAGKAAKICGVSKEEIAAETLMPVMSDIRIIKLYVDDRNKDRAALIQKAMGEALAAFAEDTDGFGSITVWDENDPYVLRPEPYYLRWALAGAVIGAVFAVLIMMYLYAADDHVYTDKDMDIGLKESGILCTGYILKSGERFRTVSEASVHGAKAVCLDKDGKETDIPSHIKGLSSDGADMLLLVPYGMSAAALYTAAKEIKVSGKNIKAAFIYDADEKFLKRYYR